VGLVGLYMTVVGSAIAFGTIALEYRAPTELETKPLGSFAKLSRRELWLILVAGHASIMERGTCLCVKGGARLGQGGGIMNDKSFLQPVGLAGRGTIEITVSG